MDVFRHTIKTVRYTQKVSKLKGVFSHTIKTVRYTKDLKIKGRIQLHY